MGNGTSNNKNMFLIGNRLRETREQRGFTRAQLVSAIELLPANNSKTRSEKQIAYIENGTRPLSADYAQLIAEVLNVRVDYLMYKDDFQTEADRISSLVNSSSTINDLIIQIMNLHHYELKDVTRMMPIKRDGDREYRESTFSLVSPRGAERYMTPAEFLSIVSAIDDYIEYQCAKQFRVITDGARNIQEWRG